MITRDEFSRELLIASGLAPSVNNVQSLVVWMTSEDTMAEWNPMATTQPMPGATEFNSAGVKNYPDQAIGIQGFTITLHNGYYGGIIDCLTRSAIPAETCATITNSAWGSKPSSALVAQVLNDWIIYASVVIPGSEAITPAPIPQPIPVPSIPTETTVTVPTCSTQTNNTGPAVNNIQLLANAQAHSNLTVDGIYGPATEAVIKSLQAFWHITQDGICGNVTWGVLCNF